MVTESIKVKEEKNSSENISYDTQQTVIESAKNSEYLISEIEKNSSENIPVEQNDKLNQMHNQSILISSESGNEESACVMNLIDEEKSLKEEKVFFMDPGFSFPEPEDLLELDLDESISDLSDEVVC